MLRSKPCSSQQACSSLQAGSALPSRVLNRIRKPIQPFRVQFPLRLGPSSSYPRRCSRDRFAMRARCTVANDVIQGSQKFTLRIFKLSLQTLAGTHRILRVEPWGLCIHGSDSETTGQQIRIWEKAEFPKKDHRQVLGPWTNHRRPQQCPERINKLPHRSP